jgi:integrase
MLHRTQQRGIDAGQPGQCLRIQPIILFAAFPNQPQLAGIGHDHFVFGGMPRSRIALETGTHSPWISRVLGELGHAYRRGLGTNLSELGIPDLVIQKVLRHGDVETTRDSYILTRPGPVAAAMVTLGEEVARKSAARSQVVLKSDPPADKAEVVM